MVLTDFKMSNPVVEVKEGKLKGKICKTLDEFPYFAFKGIPYAKPPVNDLRFAIPVSPESWEGVRDATQDCNICIQLDRATDNGLVIGDEDCLYLNVYTPKLTSEVPLPVMVFFHGGGFLYGSGTDDEKHGPDFLVDKDVVVVSINYRLGILGFLALDRKEAPGNMGLRDQVQALKWIKQNISQFGGDPNNVTIFGISAGGASVEYLLLSPLAQGLFHKAIAQSGSSLLHWAHNKNIKKLAQKIPELKGKIINDDDALYNYLMELPIKELITSSMKVLDAEVKGLIMFGFVPTLEKPTDWEPFLDKSPYKLLKLGQFTKVPYMSGFTSHEGLLMACLNKAVLDKVVKENNFIDYLPFNIEDTEKVEMDTKLRGLYLKGCKDPVDAAVDFFTDADFFGGAYVATTLISKRTSPAYFYEFAYDGGLNYLKNKYNIAMKGACHGDDGGYIIKHEVLSNDVTETDILVRNRMTTMWTNFAKYGNPTPKINETISATWEPIAETGFAYLEITDKLTMKENPLPDRAKLYETLYEKYYD